MTTPAAQLLAVQDLTRVQTLQFEKIENEKLQYETLKKQTLDTNFSHLFQSQSLVKNIFKSAVNDETRPSTPFKQGTVLVD